MPASFFHDSSIPPAVARRRDLHRAVGYFTVGLTAAVAGGVLMPDSDGLTLLAIYLVTAAALDCTALAVLRPWILLDPGKFGASYPALELKLATFWPFAYPRVFMTLASRPYPFR